MLLVLVATMEGQGQRESDFNFCRDGELVRFGFECDTDRDDIDGSCGCRRDMTGLDSGKGTTTFTVAFRHISRKRYRRLIRQSILGTYPRVPAYPKPDNVQTGQHAALLLEIANHYWEGTVLEKRGDIIQPRVGCQHDYEQGCEPVVRCRNCQLPIIDLNKYRQRILNGLRSGH